MAEFSPLQANVYRSHSLSNSSFIITDTLETLYGITVDNTANTTDIFVKIYFQDTGSAPTIGTTDPDLILRVEASKKQDFPVLDGQGILSGASAELMYFVAVTTGGTAGTTAPTNDVVADIYTS